MYKFFGSDNEVESHNKSRRSDLSLEKFWVAQCVWIRLCKTVDKRMTITNFWKLFCYGVKRDCCEKLIGIRAFLERLALHCFNNHFSTDTWYPDKEHTLPLMRLMKERQFVLAVYFNFSISDFPSTEVRTIYDITIISASSLDYTLVTSNIGSQHTAEKEGARE